MMSVTNPMITVGVPVYNGERYLEQTLQALRNQDCESYEVIICDNASTDGTEEICRRYCAADDRFSYLRNDRNRGVPFNWNRALSISRAPLFTWNSADDIAEPGHLSGAVAALAANADAILAFPRVLMIGSDGQDLGPMDDQNLRFDVVDPSERLSEFLRRRAYQVIGFGGVIRTSVLRDIGGLPAFYGGDIVLGSALSLTGPFVQIPQRLYRARRHDEQTNKLQGADVMQQIHAYTPDRKVRVAFPQWALNRHLFVAVGRAPISGGQKCRSALVMLRYWTIVNWRFLPFDVKRNAVRLLRGRYVGEFFAS